MEVLPLSAMPRFYHHVKGQTDVTYFPPPAEVGRLSKMADALSTARTMTFDERIKALQVVPRTLSVRTQSKILELLNTALRQMMLDDIGEGRVGQDYTPIMNEYVNIVRDAQDMDNEDTAMATELLSRAYRVIQTPPRYSSENVVETLNTLLLSKITDDADQMEDLDVNYSAFLVQYGAIVSEAEKATARGDETRGRALVVQAFLATKFLE